MQLVNSMAGCKQDAFYMLVVPFANMIKVVSISSWEEV
jgi:hypothetical protein